MLRSPLVQSLSENKFSIFESVTYFKIWYCLGNVNGIEDEYSMTSFLFVDMRKRVINNVRLPAHNNESYFFSSYKVGLFTRQS